MEWCKIFNEYIFAHFYLILVFILKIWIYGNNKYTKQNSISVIRGHNFSKKYRRFNNYLGNLSYVNLFLF